MTSAQLAPAVVLSLVVWRIYIRVRRSIGRQRLILKSLQRRTVILGVLTVVFAAVAAFYLPALLALLAGVALSIVLAWVAVRLTRFERTAEGDFYTPNTVIGIAVSLLLVIRFVYRMTVIIPMFTAGGAGAAQPPDTLHSPLTFGILGLTIGYYAAYYAGVLVRARHLGTGPAASWR